MNQAGIVLPKIADDVMGDVWPDAQHGHNDTIFDASGLDRKLRLFRLPKKLETCRLENRVTVPPLPQQDNPIWAQVVTEDGFLG